MRQLLVSYMQLVQKRVSGYTTCHNERPSRSQTLAPADTVHLPAARAAGRRSRVGSGSNYKNTAPLLLRVGFLLLTAWAVVLVAAAGVLAEAGVRLVDLGLVDLYELVIF